jgi:hypothetical protein
MTGAAQVLRPDPQAISGFLGSYIGDAIQLVAIDPKTEQTRGAWFDADVEKATSWAVEHNQRGFGLYWSVNRCRPGVHKKPKKEDIVAERFLHVDIDPPKGSAAFDMAGALQKLGALQYPPSFTIASGGGLGAYWRLDEPIDALPAVEAANDGLCGTLGGDNCWNADRIMRLPGTVNWPNRKKIAVGRMPAMASVISPDDGVAYPLHALAAAFPARPKQEVRERAAAAVDDGAELLSADDLFLGPLDPLRSLIERPAGQDRSGDVLRCAGKMAREGYTDAQIFGVLMNPANAVHAHLRDQSDPRYQALRCIEQVRAPKPEKASEMPPTQPPDAGTVCARPYVWIDPEAIPLRPWVYGRWLLRGVVTAVIAPGGIGKTTLLSGAALSLATDATLLGKTVWEGRKRVWIWNLEDQMAELQRSISATCKHFGIAREDLEGWLFVSTAMDGDHLCTAVEDQAGFRLMAPVFDAIVAELLRLQIDVLIIDPFVSSHEVDENANSKIDKIAKAWSRVAVAANCSVVLVHHTSKAGSGEVNALSARGAKALTDACRSVLVLNRMDPEVGERFGFDDAERRRFFNVADDKHNRAPPEKADWFRLASVDLGNGGPIAPGDSVGVATPWSPPDPFEGLTGSHLLRVQTVISNGKWREHHSSPEWAGYAVADALGLDADDKGQRRRITLLIKTWLKEGALSVTDGHDTRRKPVKFIEVGKWQSDTSAPVEFSGAERSGAPERSGCSTTPRSIKRGWSGAERGQSSQLEQSGAAAHLAAWQSNPALGARRGPILAPGEHADDAVPGWD